MGLWMLAFRPAEFARLYNCSLYNVDDIPLQQRKHVAVGSAMVLMASFFEVSRVPICTVLSRISTFPENLVNYRYLR